MLSYRKPRPIQRKYQIKVNDLETNQLLPADVQSDVLESDLTLNEQTLRDIFKSCSDVVYRTLELANHQAILLVYVDGLLDTKHLDEVVLKPLLFQGLPTNLVNLDAVGSLLQTQSLPIGQTKVVTAVTDVVQNVLKGEVALLADGESKALIASLKGWAKRSVAEPETEQVIRGPREGFIETLRVNTSLIRRKICSPKLKMESFSLGKVTQTDGAIVYIDGIATETVISEVRDRVNRIQIDGVLESGYIEEFIEDQPYSPFPTVQHTERPDVVAAALLEGRVAIMLDGTPFVLIVPVTFWGMLHANEDYYERAFISSLLRWVRLTFGFIALFLPSLYVALISFQQEMVPTTFLLSVAAAQEATPFPAIVEALAMEFMFEGLREAGVRLPKAVGSAISIVGALVIGQAAVQAGIVSAPMVIVVATTGIASFTIPRFNLGIAIRMLRFPLLILAGTFGFFGITVGLLGILLHVCSIRSFGIPYFSPLGPLTVGSLRDVLMRAPWWSQTTRPQTAKHSANERISSGQRPGPG